MYLINRNNLELVALFNFFFNVPVVLSTFAINIFELEMLNDFIVKELKGEPRS